MDVKPNEYLLPKVVVGEEGNIFNIDAENRRLIECGAGTRNIIELDKLPRHEGHGVIIYDWKTNNHADVPLETALEDDRYQPILLRNEVAEIFSVPDDRSCEKINAENRENGYGFFLLNKDLNDRLIGKLPSLDITGQKYFVELRLGRLSPENDFSSYISVEDLLPYEDKGKFTFLYHPPSKSVVHLWPGDTQLQKGVIAIQIPNQVNLDPVAFARLYDKKEGYYLDSYAYQGHRSAAILPLEETRFSKILEENRQYAASDSRKRGR